MSVSIPDCPVPPEQLPLNEYQSLKDSWFFHWSTIPVMEYLQRLFIIGVLAWGFCLPFAREAFVSVESWPKFCLAAGFGSMILLLLVVTRLYLGWQYVAHRLEKDVVEYEETGWYDGQTWPKTKVQWDRDRLVSVYEVRPLMHRLLVTLMVLIAANVLGIVSWQWI